jgi:hypothetical protein
MAYYIFLKSFRSLEEFRKNPHVKIPPKSPSTNFQSLDKFKNPIFNLEMSFFLISARPTLEPTRPLAHPAHWPCRPRTPKPSRPAHPALTSVASSREIRFPFWFAPSETAASPSSLCQPGPSCQIHPFPRVGRPEARLPRALPQLIAPRLPASIIATIIKAPYSPTLIPPLESPVTPSSAINGVGRKSPAVTHRHFLPGAPPGPIKGEHHPRVAPHLSLLLLPSLHA